ncbi:MAG: response regulator [Chloroflexia bacterium]|nr:response regulator [Chloroflexia bacterium]
MQEQELAILVVDDQPNWREVFCTLLEDDYQVTSAGSYREALQAVLERKTPFAVAIVDIRLEDQDPQNEEGLALLAKLRELSSPTSVIIVTGYPTIRTTKCALQDLQALDYVLKYPEGGKAFSLADFRRAVRRGVAAFKRRLERPQAPRRALVIEDESNWQETLVGILQKSDYVVDVASRFEEAIARIEDDNYDLMVVDLKLGPLSPQEGMELLGEIRRLTQEAELIVVSGWDTSERVRDAFARYRVLDFLMKGQFKPEQFQEAIRRAEGVQNVAGCEALLA